MIVERMAHDWIHYAFSINPNEAFHFIRGPKSGSECVCVCVSVIKVAEVVGDQESLIKIEKRKPATLEKQIVVSFKFFPEICVWPAR
jgi:hypothetical protein